MPVASCRFCLNKERVVNIFESELVYAVIMRSLIMLCPAINHQKNSSGCLSNYVCLKCCMIAVKSFKYGIYSMAIENNPSNEDTPQNQVQQNGAVVEKTAAPKKSQKPLAKKSTMDDEPYLPGAAYKRAKKTKRVGRRSVSDSESEEVIPRKKNRCRNLVDLKPEIPQPDIQNNKKDFLGYLRLVSTTDVPETWPTSSYESALVPVKVQPYCIFCKKTYSSEAYYKIHMKKHVRCHVCNNIFASDTVLQKHWKKACGRAVIGNQPTVALEYVDQNAAIVEKYSEAFRTHSKEASNEDDVIVISSDDEENGDDDIVYIGSYVLNAKIEAE